MQTSLCLNYNMSGAVNTLATQTAGLHPLALAQRQTAEQPARLGVVESQTPEHESRA